MPQRILLLGATGTIGQAAAHALLTRGHDLTCFVREGSTLDLPGAQIRKGQPADPASLRQDGFRGEAFDAVVSCLASRTGAPKDAWAIDHDAHVAALEAAQEAGVRHFVLLSAICVQKPKLAFQHAKRAFEDKLIASGLTYSIVRPTAYFKSLSGQLDRLRNGKPFLVFGDGTLTACKPISDRDLGEYLADCLDDPEKQNRILPIGGPDPAQTPREQGETLFRLLGQEPNFKQVPVGFMDAIIGALSAVGTIFPPLKSKAELAKIGRYYGTESMLVWNGETYDPDATPETGNDRLEDHFAALIAGEASDDRGDHKVF